MYSSDFSIFYLSVAARTLFMAAFSIMLVSCATTEQQVEQDVIETMGSYKYQAWRQTHDSSLGAINVLLEESDKLIENNAFDAAEDKLERVLRIKPQYAPAWSRMSWVALQSGDAARSIEMAKRSNSFSQSDPELLLLNWSFIRSASQQLNDTETYKQADQKINSLKSL